MNVVVEVVAFVVGLLIVLGTAGSLIRTLVVPRAISSRLAVLVSRKVVRGVFLLLASRFQHYETKDKILALSAPVSLIVVLLVWLALFLLGYALMLWPLIDASFPAALRESGSSMLTLGLFSTVRESATVIDFFAAVTGLIVIALQIAYLPTLYAAFNRREALVTMLQSRAGSPAWGPEILARHHLVDLKEPWPLLRGLGGMGRSPRRNTHDLSDPGDLPLAASAEVVGARGSIGDGLGGALPVLVSVDGSNPDAALSSHGIHGSPIHRGGTSDPFDPDPFPDDPIQLTYEEFEAGIERLRQVDFPMERTPEEAWPHFRGWRVNYEQIAYELADRVVAPPGPWSGERRRLRGVTIVPQRPADRTPDDPKTKAPETAGAGWRWRA